MPVWVLVQLGPAVESQEQIPAERMRIRLREKHGDAAKPDLPRIVRRRKRMVGTGETERENFPNAVLERFAQEELQLPDLISAILPAA